MSYVIKRAAASPALDLNWDRGVWRDANVADIANFHPRSSNHRPRSQAKIVYDPRELHVFFRVEDRYVRSVHTHYQDPVCRDSCVEFFVQPKRDKGYFNFEFNCGGTLLLYYIEDPTRAPGNVTEFNRAQKVNPNLASQIRVAHTMPKIVEPEIESPTLWSLQYAVPLQLFEAYTGPIPDPATQTWRGNLYKCADQTSHPHWASWSPIGECNFHQPNKFAPLIFAP